MTKEEIKQKAIEQRMWLFNQYLKDEISQEDYAKRMSEVEIDE